MVVAVGQPMGCLRERLNLKKMASFGTIFRRLSHLDIRSDKRQLPSLPQMNDSVYEFYRPPNGTSLSLEIIFFHGLERGDYNNAYVETWTSSSDSDIICWPQTLLAKEFPRARILSVSYDSSIQSGPRQGNLDLYVTAENLLQDLIDAKVAKNLGLPVILIGKDLGGLVIKAICREAKEKNRLNFLSNVKGIFYYGTPHLGFANLPTAFSGALAKRLTFGDDDIARLGSIFSNERNKNKWATGAIICLKPSEKLPELVITEASQRYDLDERYTSKDNVDTVCKCQGGNSSSFQLLRSFISTIEETGQLLSKSCQDGGGGVAFQTSLNFLNDRNYVPMARTRAEVESALQIAHIVVLHGDPGSGKSSLARHLALQFEQTARQQGAGVAAASSAEQSSWLPNGVVYLTCGNGTEIVSRQRERLRKFHILQGKTTTLEETIGQQVGALELQKMLHDKLVKVSSELPLPVVVVLDDVWNRDLVENLLVPWDSVRYLVTTQISTLWNAHDSEKVQMQDVAREDARRILGNYAKFKDGVISKELEGLADDIITATGSHPLALATMGIVLDNTGRSVAEWRDLKDNLQEHLETEDYPPSIFGQKYPTSVRASMTFVLDLLDEDAKKLLYRIALFDGPSIPESFLRLFLMCTLPRDEEIAMRKSRMSLVAKGLVRIETEIYQPVGSIKLSYEASFLWIHSLRQQTIEITYRDEIRLITNFLDDDSDYKFLHLGKRSDLDLATALCALGGSMDIKRRARKKMGSYWKWNEKEPGRLAGVLTPVVT